MPFQSNDNEQEYLEKLGIINGIINDLDSGHTFVLGNFNAYLGLMQSNFGKIFQDPCNENNLVISSKILLPSSSYTFVSERWGTPRWLDHCVSTMEAHDNINDIHIRYDLSDSDHIPFGFNLEAGGPLQIETQPESNCPGNSIW